jgi:RNA polymerase sigma-70 factor (ECF subfamily)
VRLSIDDVAEPVQPADADVVALDEALTELTALDPQQGRVVELRYFGGLSIEDTAEVLQVSVSTVKRDWVAARAWLYRELAGAP